MRGIILAVMVFALALAGCGGQEQAGETPAAQEDPLALLAADYGAEGALAGGAELSLEKMLTYAIQEEHLAEAEYLDVTGRHGEPKPFNDIVQSEREHIEALEAQFSRLGYDVPPNRGAELVVPAGTVSEALEACVEGRTRTIEMYRVFLEKELPAEVAEVFANLKAGAEKHVETFRSHLEN